MSIFFRILFFFGLASLVYVYGVLSVRKEIFPYNYIAQAAVASNAWMEVLTGERSFPLPKFQAFLPAGPLQPADPATAAPDVGEERYLLMTGGPFEKMETCPKFGCLAWVQDGNGNILHGWDVDFDNLWTDKERLFGLTDSENIYPLGIQLLENGDLIATFQGETIFPYGVGIVRVDARGKVLWSRTDYSHHWPTTGENGEIIVPGLRIVGSPFLIGTTAAPLSCETGKIYEDTIRLISPDGEILREISLLESLAESDYAGLVFGEGNSCDPTHLNSIEVIAAQDAAKLNGVQAGDFLVSLRSPNAIAVIGRQDGRVKLLSAGRTVEQHSAHFLPDGRIIAFDNFGGDRELGGSRLVAIDLVTGELETLFPKPGASAGVKMFSSRAGVIDLSPDRTRALVSVSYEGRVIEVDLENGAVLWEYFNDQDLSGFIEKRGFSSETANIRLRTLGTYYIDEPSFLN